MGQKSSKITDEFMVWRDELPGNLPLAARYVLVLDVSTVNTLCVRMALRSNEKVELAIKFDGEECFQSDDYGRWSREANLVSITRTCASEAPFQSEELRDLCFKVAKFKVDAKTGFLSSKKDDSPPNRPTWLILQRECDRCGGFGVHYPPFPDVKACSCTEVSWKMRSRWGNMDIIE